MKKNTTCWLPIIFIVAAFTACTTSRQNNKSVEAAMQRYDHFILSMQTDSIAGLFTRDGDLGTMAHGRQAIQKFLYGFREYKVLSQRSTTTSITKQADSAVQKGMYFQTTIIPPADTVHVKGTYTAVWVWVEKKWELKRMETKN